MVKAGLDRDALKRQVQDLARKVEDCRVMSAPSRGPQEYQQMAHAYLRWADEAEWIFRHSFVGSEWLTEIHTERWRQINRIDTTSVRPGGLINGEVDHQAQRLNELVASFDELPSADDATLSQARRTTDRPTFSVDDLHPKIVEAAGALYADGHFATAILQAFITVEIVVRERTGLDISGVPLMNQAMGTADPILVMTVETGQVGKDEQQGMRSIFAGAMQGIRNPKAHAAIDQQDPDRAFEYLALASLLLRRVDDAVSSRHQPLDS
jgi:uncharacterized protein (TIGR02391 family)